LVPTQELSLYPRPYHHMFTEIVAIMMAKPAENRRALVLVAMSLALVLITGGISACAVWLVKTQVVSANNPKDELQTAQQDGEKESLSAHYPQPSPPTITPASPLSDAPSDAPSNFPSDSPSNVLSEAPSNVPSEFPSNIPSDSPSDVPSDAPSKAPSDTPSKAPSAAHSRKRRRAVRRKAY